MSCCFQITLKENQNAFLSQVLFCQWSLVSQFLVCSKTQGSGCSVAKVFGEWNKKEESIFVQMHHDCTLTKDKWRFVSKPRLYFHFILY